MNIKTRIIRLDFLLIIFFLMKWSTVIAQSGIPASTNISGQEYPQILPDNRVVFRLKAPEANKIQIDLGKKYDMVKDDEGFWTVTTDPLVPGFHYYSLIIDELSVADPASETFYGMGRMASGIDIPENGVDFYKIKDVPHGALSSKYYYSKVTNSWRRLFVYTPPGYDTHPNEHYPVMYLQHGGGEDERGWAVQGKTDIILDNLIAQGNAEKMLVVISNGNINNGIPGYSSEAMAAFKEEMTGNIVPFVDKNYRTIPKANKRALCGLSMGGGQSFYVGLESLDYFGSIGIFSTGLFGGIRNPAGNEFDAEKEMPGLLNNSKSFNEKLALFYISVGEQDPRVEFTKTTIDIFKNNGLKVQFATFPGDHEWQVWRKSLYDFASRVFKQ